MDNIIHKIQLYKDRPIFKQFSWYMLSMIIGQLLSFVSVFIVYRYLGTINIGNITRVQNFTYFLFIILAGMDSYFFSHFLKAKESGDKDFMYKYYFHRNRVLFFIILCGLIFSLIFLPKDLFLLYIISIIPTILIGHFFIFLSFAHIEKKAKIIAISSIVSSLIVFLLKVVGAYFEFSIQYFIFINGLEISGIIVYLYFINKSYIKTNILSFIKPKYIDTFKYIISSKLFIFSAFTSMSIGRVDQLILGRVGDAHKLGVYVGAVKISEMPNLILGVFMSTIMPYILSFYKNHQESSLPEGKKEKVFLKLAFLLSIFCALFTIIISPYAVHIIYGDKFVESINILYIYALSIPGSFLMLYYQSVYAIKDKMYILSIMQLFLLLIYILLTIYLYYNVGVVGVAVATVIIYTLSGLLYYLKDK